MIRLDESDHDIISLFERDPQRTFRVCRERKPVSTFLDIAQARNALVPSVDKRYKDEGEGRPTPACGHPWHSMIGNRGVERRIQHTPLSVPR
jgi:hypothetical protein